MLPELWGSPYPLPALLCSCLNVQDEDVEAASSAPADAGSALQCPFLQGAMCHLAPW